MNSKLQLGCLAMLVVASTLLPSCSKDDPIPANDESVQKSDILAQYVDSVVVKTYSSLANHAALLFDACVMLKEKPTQSNIAAACTAWKNARMYWEQSEAFLYGAAADYNIDPHIDSWPLDKSQLDLALKNKTLIDNMRSYGCNFDGFSTLGYGLLGFHAIEYMIFRDGTPRNINGGTDSDGVTYAALSEVELVYCSSVAEDLRNQCFRLEASWAGIENITKEKLQVLQDQELLPTLNYGEALKKSGGEGNVIYKTQLIGLIQMLQGAADISDEVGNTKITDPVNSGNVLDVESWYSWNSITDFADNIRSVQYVYMGGTSSWPREKSLSTYVKRKSEALNNQIVEAISLAIKEIEAMPAPFRNHLTKNETANAKAACSQLLSKLDEAITLLQQ